MPSRTSRQASPRGLPSGARSAPGRSGRPARCGSGPGLGEVRLEMVLEIPRLCVRRWNKPSNAARPHSTSTTATYLWSIFGDPQLRKGQDADISIQLIEHVRRGPTAEHAERPLTNGLIEKVMSAPRSSCIATSTAVSPHRSPAPGVGRHPGDRKEMAHDDLPSAGPAAVASSTGVASVEPASVPIPITELPVGGTWPRLMVRGEAPVEHEQQVEDRYANENARENNEVHRIAPQALLVPQQI
jgi:hypothetical protein